MRSRVGCGDASLGGGGGVGRSAEHGWTGPMPAEAQDSVRDWGLGCGDCCSRPHCKFPPIPAGLFQGEKCFKNNFESQIFLFVISEVRNTFPHLKKHFRSSLAGDAVYL